MKSGRTNDEVKDAPAATWSSTRDLGGRRRPTSSRRSTRSGKSGEWTLGEHTLKLTNLDKVLFPAKKPHRALTKRDLIRHYASVAPVMLPYLAGRPVNLHRFPNGVDKPGLLAQGGAVARARVARRAGTTTTPTPARPRSTSSSTPPPRWRGSRTTARSRCTRGRRRPKHAAQADVGADRHRPRRKTTCDDVLVLARLYRTALDHLGVKGDAEGQRAAGHPDLDPGRGALHVRRHARVGRGAVAHDRPVGARPRELGVGGRPSAAAWRGSTSPRTRSTRRSSRRSVPGPRPVRRCRCRSRGTSSTTPTCSPTAGRSTPSVSGWPARRPARRR